MKTLVTIATYEQSKRAYFLKDNLEKNQIDCFLSFLFKTERSSDVVQVQVKEDDVERSIQIMLDIQSRYGNKPEEMIPEELSRKIMVPVDLSQGSEYACQYAAHLAGILKAEVKILHVYENPIDDEWVNETATFEIFAAQALREREKQVRKQIMEFIQRIREYVDTHELGSIKLHSSIILGRVLDRIKEVSSSYNPDFIVLGSSGRSDDPEGVRSGIASDIIHGLGIPVYAVPGPCRPEDFKKIRILYATDFNENDNKSLNQLLKIMEPFEKSITCIHIDTAHNPAKEERMDELNLMLTREYGDHEITCRLIEDTDVYRGLKDFAESNRINLLSFTTRKRGIFEKLFRPNLFRTILQESSIPILIFPPVV